MYFVFSNTENTKLGNVSACIRVPQAPWARKPNKYNNSGHGYFLHRGMIIIFS